MMESFEESSAAKHQRLTRRDMMQTMQTGNPNSAKTELADGVKVKKEKGAEQEVSFENQDKGEMELDDFWLQVKGEIKEEIEQEEQKEHACKSSSLDDLTRKEIMMKEEMEEDPNHDEAFESLRSQSDHSEVATQERETEKSNKATAAEPEPKPVAKRRRLTRRDMQQTMQTGGPSSVKIELADGVKVKKEKNAEQEIGFERTWQGRDGARWSLAQGSQESQWAVIDDICSCKRRCRKCSEPTGKRVRHWPSADACPATAGTTCMWHGRCFKIECRRGLFLGMRNAHGLLW